MTQINLNDTTTPKLLACTRRYRQTIQYIIRNKLFNNQWWQRRLTKLWNRLLKAQLAWDCEHDSVKPEVPNSSIICVGIPAVHEEVG